MLLISIECSNVVQVWSMFSVLINAKIPSIYFIISIVTLNNFFLITTSKECEGNLLFKIINNDDNNNKWRDEIRWNLTFALDSLMQENPTKFIQGRHACMQYQRQVVVWCLCPTYYNIHVTWIVVGVGAQSWKWTWWKGRFHAWRACSNSCSLSFPSPPCLEDHGEEKKKMETRDQIIHTTRVALYVLFHFHVSLWSVPLDPWLKDHRASKSNSRRRRRRSQETSVNIWSKWHGFLFLFHAFALVRNLIAYEAKAGGCTLTNNDRVAKPTLTCAVPRSHATVRCHRNYHASILSVRCVAVGVRKHIRETLIAI